MYTSRCTRTNLSNSNVHPHFECTPTLEWVYSRFYNRLLMPKLEPLGEPDHFRKRWGVKCSNVAMCVQVWSK